MVLPVQAGSTYSYSELEGLWINAGGSKPLAPTMAAIALAESSGNPDAQNPSGATGLWQILGAVNPADQANLTDPATNAKEAVLKQKSQGLSAWVTYTDGAYKAFLKNGVSPDLSQPGSGAGSSTSGQSAQTGTCLLSAPSVLGFGGGCIFSKTEARALIGGILITGGAAWIFVGLAVTIAGAFAQTKAGQAAGRAVGSAAETAGAGVALIPGAEAAGAGIAAAGKGAKSYSGHVQKRRQAKATQERQLERKVGEPRENRNLRTGRGAVRETGQERARRMANSSSNGSGEKVPF
jgi:Lysozyme like domain